MHDSGPSKEKHTHEKIARISTPLLFNHWATSSTLQSLTSPDGAETCCHSWNVMVRMTHRISDIYYRTKVLHYNCNINISTTTNLAFKFVVNCLDLLVRAVTERVRRKLSVGSCVGIITGNPRVVWVGSVENFRNVLLLLKRSRAHSYIVKGKDWGLLRVSNVISER